MVWLCVVIGSVLLRLAYITLFEIVEKCVIYIEINAAPRIKVNSIRFAPHIYIIHKRKQHKRNVRGFFTLARYHKKMVHLVSCLVFLSLLLRSLYDSYSKPFKFSV